MKRTIAALTVMLLPLAAQADITAHYSTGQKGHDMSISVQDDTHVRLDIGPDSYALLSADIVYMLHKEKGQWYATDLAELKQYMAGMPMGKHVDRARKTADDFKFVDTGRTEKVAGYSGNVYQVIDLTTNKKYDVVLSKAEDIARVYRGLLEISRQMVSNMGMGKSMPELPDTRGGLLRQGNQFVLTGVDKADKGDSYYALPKGVQMRKMGGASGQRPQMPSAEQLQKMDPRAQEMMKQMMQRMQQQ